MGKYIMLIFIYAISSYISVTIITPFLMKTIILIFRKIENIGSLEEKKDNIHYSYEDTKKKYKWLD